MVVVFSFDLQLALGVAGGVRYISVILVSLWLPGKKYIISFAIICSVLVILGFYLSPQGGELWKVLFNRALALFAIWITAIIALKWKYSEQEIYKIKREVEKEKEKIYLATIYGAQHVTNNLLNELQLVKLEINKHPDFDERIATLFDDMLEESNILMKQLSDVEQMDESAIKESVHPKSDPK